MRARRGLSLNSSSLIEYRSDFFNPLVARNKREQVFNAFIIEVRKTSRINDEACDRVTRASYITPCLLITINYVYVRS